MKTPFPIICRGGFTLIESVMTLAFSVLIITGLLAVFITCNRYWHQTSLDLATSRQGNQCLARMVYGVGTNIGLRGAYWATNWGSSSNWRLQSSNYYGQVWYIYDTVNHTVVFSNAHGNCVIGKNIIASQVSTTNGIGISITLRQSDGRYTNNNAMNTFVKLRAPSPE